MMANQQIFVRGNDGNLWLETGPFGAVPLPPCVVPGQGSCRVQVDGNVSNIFSQVGENRVWRTPFQALDQNTIFVLGSDNNLWLEFAPFGTVPPKRTQIDANVDTFQALDQNTVLVQGTDGNLWLEISPFGTVPPYRTQVDGSVNAFQALDQDTIFVLGNDGNLWLEYGPFGQVPLPPCGGTSSCRAQVDANVLQFWAPEPTPGSVYVLGSDLNLWYEPGPFGDLNITTSDRSQIDSNANDFQPLSFLNGTNAVLVLGHDGNLWLEYAPYKGVANTIQTRTFVDGNVIAFGAIPTAASPEDLEIFIIDGNYNLWDEHWPFGANNRTQVDGSVNSCQPLYSQPSLLGGMVKRRQPPTRATRVLRPTTRL